jgi:DivIVA domain-containing protein
MGTALIYLVVLLVVAALFFVGASAVFGRGEQLAPIPPGATPTWLPDQGIRAGDVRAVRFQQAIRGYRMAEVDWVLERLAGELDRQAEEAEGLRGRITELESAVAGARQADVVALVAGAGKPEGTEHGEDTGDIDRTGGTEVIDGIEAVTESTESDGVPETAPDPQPGKATEVGPERGPGLVRKSGSAEPPSRTGEGRP